jgi:hypothetical protein
MNPAGAIVVPHPDPVPRGGWRRGTPGSARQVRRGMKVRRGTGGLHPGLYSVGPPGLPNLFGTPSGVAQ